MLRLKPKLQVTQNTAHSCLYFIFYPQHLHEPTHFSTMKKLLIISLLCIILLPTFGQNLKRKGALGIQAEPISDSLLQVQGWGERKGIYVSKVLPETTAEQLKLKTGDILFEINGTPVSGLRVLRQLSQNLRVGEPIQIKFGSNKTLKEASGYVVARHLETSAVGEVIYDEIQYNNSYIRSIVHKPYGNKRYPAIFFIQGFACVSVELPYSTSHPTQQLIDGWVKEGYVVYRIEKPGVGDSDDKTDCYKIDYGQEVAAFQTGLNALKKYRFVDSTDIFLFGQALGGITAPLLGAENKIKGIMVYGSIIRPWFEYIMEARRQQNVLFSSDYSNLDADTKDLTPIYYDWLVNGKTLDQLMNNPVYQPILASESNPLQIGNGTMYGRHPSFYYDLNHQPLFDAWKRANTNVIAFHGECDLQSIDASESETIADIVNYYSPGKGQYKMLKNTEQNFVKVPGKKEYLKMLREGRYSPDYAAANFNKDLLKYTVEWMKLIRQPKN